MRKKNGNTHDGAAGVATPRSRKTSETWGTRQPQATMGLAALPQSVGIAVQLLLRADLFHQGVIIPEEVLLGHCSLVIPMSERRHR